MSAWTQRQSFGELISSLRIRLVTQLIGVVFICTPGLVGQYTVNEYINVSVGSNGTIYATGITDAFGMQEHSAWVSTVIQSPKGRYGTGYTSVNFGGYARADASLAFDSTDVGNYLVSASGDGYCPVYGPLGSAFVSVLMGFRLGVTTYKYDSVAAGLCTYKIFCGTKPHSCGADSVRMLAPCPHTYLVLDFLIWTLSGTPHCLPIGPSFETEVPADCQ